MTDWGAHNFFKAGEDLADLMTVAIGPIETTDAANRGIIDTAAEMTFYMGTIPAGADNLGVMGAVDFLAGFVYGMTGYNHLTEIQACYRGGELMAQEIETGIADIKKGGWNYDTQAAFEFALALLQIP